MSISSIRLRALAAALLLLCLPGSLHAAEGVGRMVVAPTRVVAGSSGNTLTFTFTADTAALRGQVLIDVPDLWTRPQSANASGPGYVSFDRGSCSSATRIVRIVGRKIVLNAVCGRGAQYKLTYAAATAPKLSADGYVFLTQTKVAAKKPRRGKKAVRARFLPLAAKKQAAVIVTGGPVDRLVVSAARVATAGVGVGVSVRALDAYGNSAADYRGTVSFASTDGQAALPQPYTFTRTDAGGHAFPGVIFRTPGTQTIHIADDGGRGADSNPIDVSPFPTVG